MSAQPLCPCGTGRALAACCGAWLAGHPAPTAEALMRSRYSAYVLGDSDYLRESWHPSTRPDRIETAEGPRWIGLKILGGEAGESAATVEFIARFISGESLGQLRETSRFRREDGRWRYLDGDIHADSARAERIGRNADCPCGSGRKFKRCCGRPGASEA